MRPRSTDSPIAVFIFFLAVYLLTLTSNFTAPHDSMTYLEMLRTKEHLWHPHHLLYHQLASYWLNIWKPVFPSAEEYFIVESLSSVFGAGTVAFAFLFLRKRFGLPLLTSWLGTGVIAFSFGIWFYSVNVEVYAPSLFFTFWTLYILSKKEWSARELWLTAVLHSIAILFHQMNILITPIVLYKIYEQRKSIYVLKSIIWYALTGIVLVGGIYFLAGRYGEGRTDLSTWLQWVRGYTTSNEYWRSLSLKTPVLAGIGFSHAFLGGHFFFRMGLERWFTSLLTSHSLGDEIFLARSIPVWVGMLVFILSLMLTGLTLFLLVKFIRRFRSITGGQYFVVVPLLLYFIINSLYFLFWVPEILEFWLGQCIVFWLLLIGTYPRVNTKFNWLVGSIMALLFIINYVSSIRPMQNLNNDIGYVRIRKVKQLAKPGDLIIVQDPWLLKEFLQYYTNAQVAVVPEKVEEQIYLQQQVQQKLQAGKNVYVFPDSRTEHASPNKTFIPVLLNQNKDRASIIQRAFTEVWQIK